jgi:hypothetical protein
MFTGLYKDELTELDGTTTGTPLYCVSFLYGRQRVILITEDLEVATTANEAYEVERCDQQMTMALHGFGLSLVNNLRRQEVIYLALAWCDLSTGFMINQRIVGI